MIEAYLQHEEERNAQGIPALPLNPEQTKSLCSLLQEPPQAKRISSCISSPSASLRVLILRLK